MLSLFLLYLIGKPFYNLAERHNRHQWGFGILGVIVYYGGSIIGSILILLILDTFSITSIDNHTEHEIGLLGIPIGLLTCLLFYRFLENKWSKKKVESDPNILDDDMI